jgi:glutamyl-tRNA synthetase
MPKTKPKLIENAIRTRFAPAPTGSLHIGGARTALFNYLFAKKNKGSFILRIEDTDVEKSKPEFEKEILENLKWLGLEWDERPYRQSARIDIYQKYLERLITEGRAYHCFCSEEELDAQRQYLMSIGQPPRYSGKCRSLSEKEVKKYLAEGKKTVIRFKVPAKKITFQDLIRGKIEFDTSLIGDFVIAKDPSHPLYNFAVTIDDYEMKITHVIRGEDLLPNTPKQILIQEILNFPQPKYAHLPLILGPDRAKLSKRHGAVSISEYRKEGYLPEALVNFMAFLGWNPGTEREIYALPSLIKEFSLERVQKGGAVFNIKRLDYLNGFYIRQKSLERLTENCLPYLIEAGFIEEVKDNPGNSGNPEKLKLFEEEKPKYKIKETGEIVDFGYLEKIIAIYQERLKKLSEVVDLADFFFKDKLEYQKNLLKWREMSDKEIKEALSKLEKIISKIKTEDWSKKNLEAQIMSEAEKVGPPATLRVAMRAGDRGYLLWPFRVALTGKEASAGPFEIAEILGKEKTLKRIIRAHNILCARPSI